MTQREYLLQLEEELKLLPQKSKNEIINFYRDRINQSLDYGEEEHKIIEKLPTPKEVADGAYQSKGKLYQVKKQKQLNRKNVIKALGTLLIFLLMFVALFSVTLLAFMFMKNKLILIATFIKSKPVELLLTESFLIVYLLLSAITLMFIYDFALIVINLLFDNIRPVFKKINHGDLIGFSFRGLFSKLFKKQKFLENTYLVLIVVLVVLGALGFINKTYIYRSMTGINKNEQIRVIDEDFNIIKIVDFEAVINLVPTDDEYIKVNYKHEFNRNMKMEVNNGELVITADASRNYDLFGFLKEPTHIITVMVPDELVFSLDVKLEQGTINIKEVDVDSLDVELNWGNVAINNSSIGEITSELDEVNWGMENATITSLEINSNRGKIYSKKDNIESFIIDSKSPNVVIEESKISEFKYTGETPSINLKNSSLKLMDINVQVGIIKFMDLVIENNINIVSTGRSQLTMDNIQSESIFLNYKGTFTGHKINSKLEMSEGSEANIFLSNISGSLFLNNSNGDIEIIDSILDELDLIVKSRSTLIKNTESFYSSINMISAICELQDFYGSELKLKIDNSNLTFKNNNDTKEFTKITEEFTNITTRNVEGVRAEEWNR